MDYSKCVIYKLVGDEGVYIGHTTQLEIRGGAHHCPSNRCYSNKLTNTQKPIILEEYPCTDLTEARQREQYWMDKEDNLVNKARAFNNRDDYAIYQRQYLIDNRKKINENQRKYERKSRAEKTPTYLAKLERAKERVTCSCGMDLSKKSLKKHKERKGCL